MSCSRTFWCVTPIMGVWCIAALKRTVYLSSLSRNTGIFCFRNTVPLGGHGRMRGCLIHHWDSCDSNIRSLVISCLMHPTNGHLLFWDTSTEDLKYSMLHLHLHFILARMPGA